MKKILSVFIVVLALCLCLSAVASAGDWEHRESFEHPVITKGAESIIYEGKTYLPIRNMNFASATGGYEYGEAVFADDETENKYNYFDVATVDEYDYLLRVNTGLRNGYDYSGYYIEQSHYDEVLAFVNDGGIDTAAGFCTHNDYEMEYGLTAYEISQWLDSGLTSVTTADNLFAYDKLPLYKTDTEGAIHKQIGLILRHSVTDDTYNYYLIYYPEYDRSCFYADGSFATDSPDIDVMLYQLSDASLVSRLDEFYDTMPEDDLDWIVNEKEPSIKSLIAISVVLFGLLPLGLIVLSLVFIVKKGKRPYRDCYVALSALSAVIIICFIIVLVMLI